MITISMARVIRTPRAGVWRALSEPSELIRWDRRRTRLDAPAPDYPAVGSAVSWRVALGRLTLCQREEPYEVVANERLRSTVWMGSFRFDESYVLSDEPMGTTRVSLTISARNSMPLLGGELDRFDVRRMSTERAAETLEWLQGWCEGAAGRAQMCSSSSTQRSREAKRPRPSGERSIEP